MVVIPGPVEFMMGSPTTETGRQDSENQHKRRINRTVAIAATAVTQEQCQRVVKSYKPPNNIRGSEGLPVVGLSWYQAAAYCNLLSKAEGIPEDQWCYDMKGQLTQLKQNYLNLTGYRLPTESELEYATRAGAVTARFYGETEALLAQYAWYQKNAQEQIRPVGILKPNDLGLFDVHGNVWAWCQDGYKPHPRTEDIIDDKEGDVLVERTAGRVMRGGSFNDQAGYFRSALRVVFVPTFQNINLGIRVSRTLVP